VWVRGKDSIAKINQLSLTACGAAGAEFPRCAERETELDGTPRRRVAEINTGKEARKSSRDRGQNRFGDIDAAQTNQGKKNGRIRGNVQQLNKINEGRAGRNEVGKIAK